MHFGLLKPSSLHKEHVTHTERERERENCDFIIPSEIISRLDYIVFDFTRAFGVDIGSFYSQPWP